MLVGEAPGRGGSGVGLRLAQLGLAPKGDNDQLALSSFACASGIPLLPSPTPAVAVFPCYRLSCSRLECSIDRGESYELKLSLLCSVLVVFAFPRRRSSISNLRLSGELSG